MWHLRALPHFSPVLSFCGLLAAHSLGLLTCFLDVGKVSCDRSRFAEPTLVLRKDAKGVGVANDEVGDDAAGAVVTLQDREPQLWVPGRRRVRHHSFGLFFSFFLSFCFVSPHVELPEAQNASLPPSQTGLTPDFLSAFCTVYPRSSVLPVSCGGVHSRVALEPQTSTNLIL